VKETSVKKMQCNLPNKKYFRILNVDHFSDAIKVQYSLLLVLIVSVTVIFAVLQWLFFENCLLEAWIICKIQIGSHCLLWHASC